MSAAASQITSLTIVYSNVWSHADQRKQQSPALLAFVRGIYRWRVDSPHKWPVTRKMFPSDDVIIFAKGYGIESHLISMTFSTVTPVWVESKSLPICSRIGKRDPVVIGMCFPVINKAASVLWQFLADLPCYEHHIIYMCSVELLCRGHVIWTTWRWPLWNITPSFINTLRQKALHFDFLACYRNELNIIFIIFCYENISGCWYHIIVSSLSLSCSWSGWWVGWMSDYSLLTWSWLTLFVSLFMMTSSNGNIFCDTGPLWGEFTGHRWIPRTRASDAEFLWFLSSVHE